MYYIEVMVSDVCFGYFSSKALGMSIYKIPILKLLELEKRKQCKFQSSYIIYMPLLIWAYTVFKNQTTSNLLKYTFNFKFPINNFWINSVSCNYYVIAQARPKWFLSLLALQETGKTKRKQTTLS